MTNQVRVGVSAPGAKDSTKQVTDLHSAFAALQKQGAKGLGIGIGAGVAVKALDLVGDAVGGVTGYIGDAIGAASDLNETMSKSDVVFGESARQVSQWGDTTAEAFGLSKRVAVEAAASFGNVFKGLDIASDKSAQMSEQLVGLAGDLASFNNIDPTDALDKLRSGLAGESEPLRSVGVFLNEATVKAEALKLGLGDAHGELTEGEKVLARYQLILEQTTTAQGDFARTSDGVANSQRRLNAELENRQAQVGEVAIPVEKTWLDLQFDLFKGIGNVADVVNLQNKSYSEQARILREGGVLLATHSRAELEAAAAALDQKAAIDAQMDAYEAHRLAVQGGTRAISANAQAMADAVPKAEDLDSAIKSLSDTIDNDLFGDAINAGHEAQLKLSIRDLIDQREAAHKGSLKWLELTGEIADNRKALFDLHLEEAAAKGPQAAIDFLKKERTHAGQAKDEIDKLIAKYQALADLQGTLGPIIPYKQGPASHHRASGGPVTKGEMYTVGEQGPETFIAPSSGTIIPTGGLPMAGSSAGAVGTGGELHVHVHVDGGVLTPGGVEETVRKIGPGIVRYIQQRGMLPQPRAF